MSCAVEKSGNLISPIFGSRFAATCLLLVLLLAARAAAQGELPANYGDRPKHGDRVKSDYENNLAKFKGIPDVLVLPGLIANRKEQRVRIMAEATGLTEGTTLDFLLIGPGSGRGYEALAWSHARPSDVHKALEFIGVRPGQPFSPARLRFWSKGERVRLTIGPLEADELIPFESLVTDKNTGEPLPADGFVFTGSRMVTNPGERSQRVYAADFLQPQSIASIFNDPIAVLDVPRRARLSEVYGTQVVSPEYDFERNELLSIVIEPEYKDGRRRVRELTLDVRLSSPATTPQEPVSRRSPTVGSPLANFEFLLTDSTGKSIGENRDLVTVLDEFNTLVKKGHDPYVSVRFDRTMPLTDVRRLCRTIGAIDSESGIRVEPPAAGQLYYRALLPSAEWKDRENRILQPRELRLAQAGGKISGTLTLVESSSPDGGSEPKLKVTEFDVDSSEAIRERLDADAERRREAGRDPAPPILLVFADGDIAYGRLLDFLSRALATHNTIHVFLESRHPDRAAEKP
jgi:hypothetical protein